MGVFDQKVKNTRKSVGGVFEQTPDQSKSKRSKVGDDPAEHSQCETINDDATSNDVPEAGSDNSVERNKTPESLKTPTTNIGITVSGSCGLDSSLLNQNIIDNIAKIKLKSRGSARQPEKLNMEITTIEDMFANVTPTPAPTDVIIIGTDEAGRGPLMGPVVAAAVYLVPDSPASKLVYCDSKLISHEKDREELFNRMMGSAGLVWGYTVTDHKVIDKMNVLNASLLSMTMSIHGLTQELSKFSDLRQRDLEIRLPGTQLFKGMTQGTRDLLSGRDMSHIGILIDGNVVPHGLREPITNEVEFDIHGNKTGYTSSLGWYGKVWNIPHLRSRAIIKGDNTHRTISAASIVAKVSRDRIVNKLSYNLYESPVFQVVINDNCAVFAGDPITHNVSGDVYNVHDNKGYPTKDAKHMIMEIGIGPYHRLSFNPTSKLLLESQLFAPKSMESHINMYVQEMARRKLKSRRGTPVERAESTPSAVPEESHNLGNNQM